MSAIPVLFAIWLMPYPRPARMLRRPPGGGSLMNRPVPLHLS